MTTFLPQLIIRDDGKLGPSVTKNLQDLAQTPALFVFLFHLLFDQGYDS